MFGNNSDKLSDEKKRASAESSGPIGRQWKKFCQLVFEPWTFSLLLVSVVLFAIGQSGLTGSVNALVQILLAVASGVLGARVTNLIAEASGQGILTARGKVAVRGLKLMLVQTAAFQRRVQRFLESRDHIENHPEVTVRNFEETIEFCRRIQEEAASAMETWGDVVPTVDLSSLIGRITEAEDQRDANRRELDQAKVELEASADNAGEADRLRGRVAELERQASKSEDRVVALTRKLDKVSQLAEPSVQDVAALEALRNAERTRAILSHSLGLRADEPAYANQLISIMQKPHKTDKREK